MRMPPGARPDSATDGAERHRLNRPLPASNADALHLGARLDDYEIESVLQSGDFSVVYRARREHSARFVTIEEYLPAVLATRGSDQHLLLRNGGNAAPFDRGLRAFVDESKLLAAHRHPALPAVERWWLGNGTAYREVAYVQATSLRALRDGMVEPPDEEALRAVVDGLLGALETLHAAGYTHGAISPHTVVLRAQDDSPLLMVHGAAQRAILGDGGRAVLRWLDSPRGEDIIAEGPWLDLLGLADLARFCIDGRHDVRAPAAAHVPVRGLTETAAALSQRFPGLQYSASFIGAIEWALASRPHDRPESVAEFRAALERPSPGERSLAVAPQLVPRAAPAPVPPPTLAPAPARPQVPERAISIVRARPPAVAPMTGSTDSAAPKRVEAPPAAVAQARSPAPPPLPDPVPDPVPVIEVDLVLPIEASPETVPAVFEPTWQAQPESDLPVAPTPVAELAPLRSIVAPPTLSPPSSPPDAAVEPRVEPSVARLDPGAPAPSRAPGPASLAIPISSFAPLPPAPPVTQAAPSPAPAAPAVVPHPVRQTMAPSPEAPFSGSEAGRRPPPQRPSALPDGAVKPALVFSLSSFAPLPPPVPGAKPQGVDPAAKPGQISGPMLRSGVDLSDDEDDAVRPAHRARAAVPGSRQRLLRWAGGIAALLAAALAAWQLTTRAPAVPPGDPAERSVPPAISTLTPALPAVGAGDEALPAASRPVPVVAERRSSIEPETPAAAPPASAADPAALLADAQAKDPASLLADSPPASGPASAAPLLAAGKTARSQTSRTRGAAPAAGHRTQPASLAACSKGSAAAQRRCLQQQCTKRALRDQPACMKLRRRN